MLRNKILEILVHKNNTKFTFSEKKNYNKIPRLRHSRPKIPNNQAILKQHNHDKNFPSNIGVLQKFKKSHLTFFLVTDQQET